MYTKNYLYIKENIVHSPKNSFYETELFLADWKTGLLCRMIQMMREQNTLLCTI